MKVHAVQAKVTADWGGDPVRAQNVQLAVTVEADASEREIQDLIGHTDRVAEIPNSLRLGTEVKLSEGTAISRKSTTATRVIG
jgi:hypothetical protein